MSVTVPNCATLDPDEIRRINRVRIAERLHKLPSEVDSAPFGDIQDILEVWRADEMLSQFKKKG